MSTITYPSGLLYTPTSCEWGIRSATTVWTSPYNGETTTVERAGARLVASLDFNNQAEANRGRIEAVFAQLRGRANRLAMYNFKRPRPQGTVRGTATLNGTVTAGATTLVLSGATVNGTLFAGDWLGIGGQVRMVVADATANGSGAVTVQIEPPLRLGATTGATVNFEKPTALFILDGDEWRGQALRGGIAGPCSYSLVEVFS
jgi:hypothetical protein